MQLESKDFYKIAAEEHGVSFELIKSVGDMVFKELSELQRDPPNLILQIRGIGRRFVRKKKLQEKLEGLDFDRRDHAIGTLRRTIEEVEADQIILDRLATFYERYLIEKQRIKNLRNELAPPTEPSAQSQTLRETGEDNQGEREGFPAGPPEELRYQD